MKPNPRRGATASNETKSASLQFLLSTMDQEDLDVVDRLNIRSDVLIINQADRHERSSRRSQGQEVLMLTFAERGVGRSRNTALDRARGDICLFADDDVVYRDDATSQVLEAFAALPDADVILFNLDSADSSRRKKKHIGRRRVRWRALRYGMPAVAVRRASIRRANVHFSLGFGGGAKFSAGEDTLFISDCLKSGLRIYTDDATLGTLSYEESSWFRGFNDTYFFDRGVLFAALSPNLWPVLCLRFAIKMSLSGRSTLPVSRTLSKLTEGARHWPRADF